MRKLLLIAMLAVSTLAWAHGAKKTDQSQVGGNDWYQAMLNPQIEQFVRLNNPEVIATPAVAFSETPPFQAPASMAARQGGQGSDWYDQRVKIAAEVNQRALDCLKGAPELEKNARLQTH